MWAVIADNNISFFPASVWLPALWPTLSLWQLGYIQAGITIRQKNAAADQEMVNQMICLGSIFHHPLSPSLKGEQSSLDKVITGWLSGEEMLMNPDKACGLLAWWSRLWEDNLITFHLAVINWLLELEEKCSLVTIFRTSFEAAMSRGHRKREITLRFYCDWVQLFTAVTPRSCEAVLVSEK